MSQPDKRSAEVHKFGGTSLADVTCYRRVAQWIVNRDAGQLYVVASASAGVTDALEALYKAGLKGDLEADALDALLKQQQRLFEALLPDADPIDGPAGDRDVLLEMLRSAGHFRQGRCAVLAYGELWSSRLLAALVTASGRHCQWLDARQIIRLRARDDNRSVDLRFGREQILKLVRSDAPGVAVLPGFIASTHDHEVVTLGRDGSDYSASIIAALVHAPELTIWTDVSGIRCADPARFPEAELCPELSYREAALLAASGGNVLHPDTLSPLLRRGAKVHIRNSVVPYEQGSQIAREVTEGKRVRSLAVCQDRLAIQVVARTSKCWRKLREALEHLRAPVVYGSAGNEAHWVVIRPHDLTALTPLLNSPAHGGPWRVNTSAHVGIVTLVGNPAAATPLEQGLTSAGLTTIDKFVAEGRAGLCVLTAPLDCEAVAEHCYQALMVRSRVNLAVIGCGLVGQAFLRQLAQVNQPHLRLSAVVNTRGCLRSRAGLDPLRVVEPLNQARGESDLSALVAWLARLPGRTVLLDVTADDDVACCHQQWLRQGFDVITANKGALAAPLRHYRRLQDATMRGSRYAYETTVGAALPVIETAQSLIRSGQRFVRLEAVLSGSLSWLLNGFEAGGSFRQRIEQAMALGLCEPDPRADLGGEDVVRKVLILARELGLPVERKHISVQPLLETGPAQTPLAAWWAAFDRCEQAMQRKQQQAEALGGVLRYVARLEPGSARIGLEVVAKDHPIARLRGADNMVCFFTSSYDQHPLVIQGAGAGPEQTAGGLMSDLVRLARAPRAAGRWSKAA